MEEKVRKEKEQQCLEAHNVFLKESLSGFAKFDYLPQWLKRKSYYLKKERLDNLVNAKNYKIYKRGTIVFVDFGINVGSELSGNHFAIVINKKDNGVNNVLTVIPISSKQKNCYIPIGKIINEESFTHLEKEQSILKNRLINILVYIVKNGNVTYPKLKDTLKQLYDKHSSTSLASAKKYLIDNNIEYDSPKKLKESVSKLNKEVDMFAKVIGKYDNYRQKSYAMPLNIQSVSKRRIMKMNKYDPSGTIKANYEIMNQLDLGIISYFTNNKDVK